LKKYKNIIKILFYIKNTNENIFITIKLVTFTKKRVIIGRNERAEQKINKK
jgi:hypothetical protein